LNIKNSRKNKSGEIMYDKIYDDYKKIIDEKILSFMPDINEKSEILEKSMAYSLKAGGKRIRPVILLAACQFADENNQVGLEKCLPFALAIEYIHTYSLIHDDLPAMDDDTLRRGKPTNHVVFGEDMAILAGDGLLNSAFEIMIRETLRENEDREMTKRMLNAMNSIATAAGCKGMVAGQVSDVQSEGKSVSNEMLDYINERKTGAMIVGAIQAGGYIGGADEKSIDDLTRYAENIGLAFQIRDDILDVIGDEKQLGKNIGSDKRQDKSTYVTVHGLRYSEEKLAKITNKAIEFMKKYGDRGKFFMYLAEKLALRKS
jgi:Geranylgeranyl pyrophosphate synthase